MVNKESPLRLTMFLTCLLLTKPSSQEVLKVQGDPNTPSGSFCTLQGDKTFDFIGNAHFEAASLTEEAVFFALRSY